LAGKLFVVDQNLIDDEQLFLVAETYFGCAEEIIVVRR